VKLVHIGRCESGTCEGHDGERGQLWILGRARLCWFCWRTRLGLPTDHETVARNFGEAFAEMVTMARSLGGQKRGAA
jgi:hypothetical protein